MGVPYVMDSRSLDFADEIPKFTHGDGVDIVLNSLTGDSIRHSLALLRPGGRFLEIGKADMWSSQEVSAVNKEASYFAIDVGQMIRNDPASIGGTFRQLSAWLEQGVLRPLPMRVFPYSEAAQAFRHMARAKHIGKVVVSQRREFEADRRASGTGPLPLSFRSDGSYLLIGGLGGLGLRLARWMAQRGAGHLVLMARRSPTAKSQDWIEETQRIGASVRIIQGDAACEDDLRRVIAEIASSGAPLRGVFHAAVVLDDGVLSLQNRERFASVMAPKVLGAWNLHRLTRDIPLDFFVLFSSISALLGSPGQGNYAAANAFLDALAHRRRGMGLPALSIDWGAWSEVGVAAERGIDRSVAQHGISAFSPDQGLMALESLLAGVSPQVGVMRVEWPKFLESWPCPEERSFFANLVGDAPASRDFQQAPAPSLLTELEGIPPAKRDLRLRAFVSAQVAHVLNLGPTQMIDAKQPFSDLGLDSLMAVELRNLLGAGLGLERPLPATVVFDHPTIASLTRYVADRWLPREAPDRIAQPRGNGKTISMIDRLEQLSDDEVERMLATKDVKNRS